MNDTKSTELGDLINRIAYWGHDWFNGPPNEIMDISKTDATQAIEAYVAQKVNETLADCYADGLINARTRAAFKSVNNKMGGEE